MGRVIDSFYADDKTITYEVRFPNKEERDISELDLFARCYGPLGDPSEILAIGASETQRWHDARWSTLESLVLLRSVANNLSGLSTSSVELVPHQADAVRRVLSDPLQRYLLGDEVGLGKTVEAGAIIRQIHQDYPEYRILVVVPTSLLRQWEGELQGKFGLDIGDRLRVIDHDAISSFEGHVDLLVVDEAHRIVRGNLTFDSVTALSNASERLLLLSATPMVGNEQTFLDLLRWLDPKRWELVSLEIFEHYVSRSQEYGRLLLGLRSDASKFVLKQRALGAKQEFHSDKTVQALSDSLLGNLELPEKREQCCDALREYIANTYRIHHRIVRARRSELEGWEFQPRGPASIQVEVDEGSGVEDAVSLIEDWRGAALLALDDDPNIEDSLVERYMLLLETAGRGISSLSIFNNYEQIFSGESNLLSTLSSCASLEHSTDHANFIALIARRRLKFLRQKQSTPKLIVFATEASFATAITEALIAEIGTDSVVYTNSESEKNSLNRFECDPRTVVAVLDQRGEEGINLHFADAVIHADLPFSIGRIEQRIGRLDRFGRTKGPIKHIAVIPADNEDTPWSAWVELLESGIEIFDRSVSDLQFAIETIEKKIWRYLFVNGFTNIKDFLATLKKSVKVERRQLDEQFALDQLAMSREPAKALVESMEKAEEDESQIADRVERLLEELLNFHIIRNDNELELEWRNKVLLPRRYWRPVFRSALNRRLTWKRYVAVNRPGVSLLRPGAPLLNALERLLEWDDRGSAFATWRFQCGFGGVGEERLYFRLCWIISPGPIPQIELLGTEDSQALRRRAERHFPTWTLIQHVGADLEETHEKEVLGLLEPSFNPRGDFDTQDFNLSHRLTWLHSVIGVSEFANLCAQIREHGEKMLERNDEYIKRRENAVRVARRDNERWRQRIEMRVARGDLSAEREFEFDAAVMRSVQNPKLRLDSVGAFVLAGYIPEGGQ